MLGGDGSLGSTVASVCVHDPKWSKLHSHCLAIRRFVVDWLMIWKQMYRNCHISVLLRLMSSWCHPVS